MELPRQWTSTLQQLNWEEKMSLYFAKLSEGPQKKRGNVVSRALQLNNQGELTRRAHKKP